MEPKQQPFLGPAKFRVLWGDTVFALFGLVVLGTGGAFLTWSAINTVDEFGAVWGPLSVLVAGLLELVMVGMPVYFVRRARRDGTIVIDPDRGEIRIGQAYEIPFSQVRQIEVVEHEYTYRAINSVHDTVTSDMTGWAIDLGAGRRLLGENGLSQKRVTEIADALRLRVDAYRARTNEGIAPLPPPSDVLLKRIAGALKEQGQVFEPDWLDPDGPMADEIRYWGEEPNESTMGPDGAFAHALRKAGYDLGESGR